MKEKQFIVLIIYDIVDNKTRSRMVKCLEQYGVRVQKSAFEALLTEVQYRKLIRESQRIINHQVDSLRVYILDDVVNVYTWGIGERKEQDCIIL
ncbi:CRISPR-associated endonuclease Cas2 [Veillonella magna]|uniref:CRISPR-associated endonuclease Cas2 n=1 Tax=Veillonella magna TaxID=464322 RepID=UPI0023F1F710|nr:CRISPR-associated endonuclease Cas2 [Veillonella magna]MBD8975634.1 CRISPR-associated endonuclease Cas2 [Veillonella magna]